MFKRDKRGISEIISTILIIFISIIAVVIVWGFIKGLLKAPEEGQMECLGISVDVSKVECVPGGREIKVTVTRGGDSIEGTALSVSALGDSGASANASGTLISLGSSLVRINASGVGSAPAKTTVRAGLAISSKTICSSAAEEFSCDDKCTSAAICDGTKGCVTGVCGACVTDPTDCTGSNTAKTSTVGAVVGNIYCCTGGAGCAGGTTAAQGECYKRV